MMTPMPGSRKPPGGCHRHLAGVSRPAHGRGGKCGPGNIGMDSTGPLQSVRTNLRHVSYRASARPCKAEDESAWRPNDRRPTTGSTHCWLVLSGWSGFIRPVGSPEAIPGRRIPFQRRWIRAWAVRRDARPAAGAAPARRGGGPRRRRPGGGAIRRPGPSAMPARWRDGYRTRASGHRKPLG